MQITVNGITYDSDSTGKIGVTRAENIVKFANILSEINGKPVNAVFSVAFLSHPNLSEIIIPDSITKIGDSAFMNCKSLQSIKIPNSVTVIDNMTFTACSSLESITIPNSVTEIGRGAFAYCESLASINIPDSIAYIGVNAFNNCPNISHVRFSQALVDRPDADDIFNQLFEAGLKTREVLLRIPTL